MDDLKARGRAPEIVKARELLLVVGVERYRLKVNALARELGKTPEGMSQALARAVRRRADDRAFQEKINQLDRRLAATRGPLI